MIQLKKTINIIVTALFISLTLISCKEHVEIVDKSMKVGSILCTDGSCVSLEECQRNGYTPIAVVFHTFSDSTLEGRGYAVYLHDLPSHAFADSIGTKQNTSSDIKAMDGNSNTHALFTTKNIGSPMADAVFSMWKYGQSAYIPSYAQMNLIYYAKSKINPIIKALEGDIIPTLPEECWYWTSTEVSGQEESKAWLYSTASGIRHETPKDERHKVRAIVTIY